MLDPHRLTKSHGGKHVTVRILNVDPVVQDYPSFLLHGLSERSPHLLSSMFPGGDQVRQFDTLKVRRIEVIRAD
jgi:hypothetical protein